MHQSNNFAAKDCNLTNKQLQTEQNEAKKRISFDVCQQFASFRCFYDTKTRIIQTFWVTCKILCLIVNKNQKEPFSMYVALQSYRDKRSVLVLKDAFLRPRHNPYHRTIVLANIEKQKPRLLSQSKKLWRHMYVF